VAEVTTEELRRAYDRRSTAPPRQLSMSYKQSALLYNVLIDNPRVWNAPLREQLRQMVTPTESFNARAELLSGEV
jgi:hypothetical protein